jgi:hypothetical protein
MRGRQPRPRLPGSTTDRNGMKHADLMTGPGPGGSVIVLWRTNDVDGKHSARAPSEAPSRVPAAHWRPSPTKAVPVRPAATVKRRPAPGIARCPDISGAGIGDPAAIPVRIEVRVLCHGGLPHLALTGNVVPASVRIQIGPPVALIACETIARSCSACRCIGCGLIACPVPLVPGILFYVLRHGILAAVGGIASQRLTCAHIFLVAVRLRCAGVFNLHRAIENRDCRGRLIQIDANRSIHNWRDKCPTRVNDVKVPGGCAQLCIDEPVQDRELRVKDLRWICIQDT